MIFSKRLSYRLTRNTVVVALLLGIVLSLIQVMMDYLNQTSSLDHEIRALITITQAPASQIAYNLDTPLAEDLLEGLLKHPAIVKAQVRINDDHILASRDRALAASPYRWLSDLLFNPSRSYQQSLMVPQLPNISVGSIEIMVDTYPAGGAFLNRAAVTLFGGFVRSLVLSTILLLLYYFMLTKPLVKVSRAISLVDPDAPEKVRLPVPRGHEEDEIGWLVKATNQHLNVIERSLEQLKIAETRLKSYSEELEEQVRARTQELFEKNQQLEHSNAELHLAKEEAVRREQARANFLANMSHEIRTPLNGIMGMISLTLDEPLTELQREQLNLAYGSSIALLDLLNDILDIAKVEAGKLTLEQISFNLRKMVEDVAALLAQSPQARQVVLHTDIQPDFPERVKGDPTRIRQIINNLTGNALKFTEEGMVVIRLYLDETRHVIIEVQDTGIGIPEDRLETIFAPFSQGQAETTRKYGGTGLGLTLCRQLATAMRGQIEVSSVLGQGSTFRTRLPLELDTSTPSPDIPARLRDFDYLLLHRPNNQTFLSLERQLRHWGLEPRRQPYDSLTEIQLQDRSFKRATVLFMDSRALLPFLHHLPEPDLLLPVLVSSRRVASEIKALDVAHHCQFLGSPMSRDALLSTLRRIIGQSDKSLYCPPPPPANPRLNQPRILLVEDNRVNQMVATAMLEKIGCRVSLANNGQEAIQKLEQDRFELILMDCQMPIMDGFEATRRIRGQSRFQHLPIIAMTANVMREDQDQCLNAGMNDFLTKPYDRETLAAMLIKWLPQETGAGTEA